MKILSGNVSLNNFSGKKSKQGWELTVNCCMPERYSKNTDTYIFVGITEKKAKELALCIGSVYDLIIGGDPILDVQVSRWFPQNPR